MHHKHPIGEASVRSTGFQRIWLMWVAFGFFVHSVYVLIGQVIFWLKHGEWIALPSTYLFTGFDLPWRLSFIPTWFVGTWRWLESPSSWYGVHKLIYGTLESLSIPGLSFLIAVLFFFIALSGNDAPAVKPPSRDLEKEDPSGT